MLRKHALITGIHGFCGRHLARHLVQNDYAVSGIDLVADTSIPDVTVFGGDVGNLEFVRRVMVRVCPTHVFHLAAVIAPQAKLTAYYETNVLGTESVLAAVRSTVEHGHQWVDRAQKVVEILTDH